MGELFNSVKSRGALNKAKTPAVKKVESKKSVPKKLSKEDEAIIAQERETQRKLSEADAMLYKQEVYDRPVNQDMRNIASVANGVRTVAPYIYAGAQIVPNPINTAIGVYETGKAWTDGKVDRHDFLEPLGLVSKFKGAPGMKIGTFGKVSMVKKAANLAIDYADKVAPSVDAVEESTEDKTTGNIHLAYGGKLASKYITRLAYGGDWTGVPTNTGDEIDYTQRPAQYMDAIKPAQYQMPKSTVNMKGDYVDFSQQVPEEGTNGDGKSGMDMHGSTLRGMATVDAGVQIGSAMLVAKAQKRNNPNSTYTPDGQYRTVEGAKGISNGWAMGNKVMPGIGGIVGAFAGGIYGVAKGSKLDKQAKLDRGYQDKAFQQSRALEMEGRQRLQGEQQYGRNSQMYGNGGNLSAKFLAGLNPSISQTSSSTTEIRGKSHEDGGVPIKGTNKEVEKGETTSGDYVFSKRLGFASIHKPLAKAKGMIEEKPMTASRINSLKLLEQKEHKLSMAQEYIKNTLNL